MTIEVVPAFKVVVPARLSSERLPEKPLADVAGKPLVVRCLERAMETGAEEVVVAVDDARIAEAVDAAGGQAMLTSKDHATGTDRLAEVADARGWADDTVVVNLQGDEPLMPPELVRRVARDLAERAQAGLGTLATPIRDAGTLFSESVVKVVLDDEGFALYFSRAPIPWVRGVFGGALGGEAGALELPTGVPFLRHLGLYAYRAGTLRRLSRAARGGLEGAESLEQLRALSLGIPIHVGVISEAPPHGVDTPADLERVRAIFAGRS